MNDFLYSYCANGNWRGSGKRFIRSPPPLYILRSSFGGVAESPLDTLGRFGVETGAVCSQQKHLVEGLNEPWVSTVTPRRDLFGGVKTSSDNGDIRLRDI